MKQWLRGLLGQKGERRAASFLSKKGMKVLARGVANPFGEIDLVALDGNTIVFVEVRTPPVDGRRAPGRNDRSPETVAIDPSSPGVFETK